MEHWIRVTLTTIGVTLAGVVGAAALGSRSWNRATARTVARVRDAGQSAQPRSFDAESLAGLPTPVARYFEFALTPGQPMIRTARVEHVGEFRTRPEAAWSSFHSTQHFSADPPGFVWDARIEMLPLVSVRVRDRYLGGEAGMLGKVAALIPVVDQQGSPELASGALHRFLAESAWLPTALLPRDGLVWEAVDDSTARVTLTDSGVRVWLDVHFAATGEIARVEGERYRDVDGVGVLTPFTGHFRDYMVVDGMRVPGEGEVEWVLPEGRFSYWKGRVRRIDYDFGTE